MFATGARSVGPKPSDGARGGQVRHTTQHANRFAYAASVAPQNTRTIRISPVTFRNKKKPLLHTKHVLYVYVNINIKKTYGTVDRDHVNEASNGFRAEV